MSNFSIYPAIDMRGGKCVRLLQGDYDKETVYGDSPVDMAAQFAGEGAKWIHMVDLDGAKAAKRVNNEFVLEVKKKLGVNVQIGGGIRSEEDVAYYLENGIDRVILGSAAISNPEFVKKMLRQYGEKIAIGIDARDGYVATEGWLETSTVKATELGKELAEAGAETFIFTDISTDGMLSGPNVEGIVSMAKATGKSVIASGGVSKLADLKALQAYEKDGVIGAIVGKALYTNQFTVSQALEEVTS
ncbi:1-(5-phosphoribosyl)-5-[(5-phosphoribosylamino)methylideneamino]imidazole-4-carboxamide isomerase [Priestia flexa]|jgi:phosphoribosylformimino-5-aminoimidazole carboxamide ribotide isomerase|uniref:1-(5-phosphoribosyl)-5-[(5-phosphoribosylamino)methylideneamino] imidazole-4-carboxamide isomerase n=1 Tax=Priestia flexa TaxID=86664 RepID=A0A1N6PLG4_9BACI|nr:MULTISPECIES: 1-(5-phosphoribosyl)-5-[(5-phosphoribosylamino)methylideneamino]imidazole-4-carboxamide isomerase [Bacillaceae]AQX53264.1 1-(5-phosphoribosyl)-5-[(5-phosphoribosylamino)methylideneamino]imidazole-4-carboxamide isomerase [Priestia flexa]KZB91668.1 1-(5-phosphoribosyl)-5-[(5-phosphoribosylamino)methylideneamino]imidazole-4-carboxamide isomerase [Bacillus sp. VT 712]MBN8253027.1 1-(5-phosphoribosyl)-5-[(5-phosphoribosylamino)methylideneamino]imidazole-4-carboxamide isomerase [Pries